MIYLSNFEIRKVKLKGSWFTEDIDNEHLQLRGFSIAEKNSIFKFCNERYVVFLERVKEISKKEYELIFKEQFYLCELQQIFWCISTKQKYGTVSNLNFADYENVFHYSFDFNSIWVDKDLGRNIRLCFNKLSKNKKIPLVYIIIYHRYLNESKRYLQGHFYFHSLEIQQVEEFLEKINNEISKKQSISY